MSVAQVRSTLAGEPAPVELHFQRPYLYPKQLAAIYDPHRYSLIEASTKAGKTSACIVWIIEKALGGQDGWNYWWVAPVGVQAIIAFRRSIRALPPGMGISSLTHRTITLINGAVIWFKSADKPDSLYGEDVYACVIDEASRVKEDAWYAIRSTLTATRGPVRIIGNVKGRKNWFYRMARRAQARQLDEIQTGAPSSMAFHRMTAHDAVAAGVLEAEEIEDARRELPEHVFRELYLAEAAEDDTNPFGVSAIRKCIAPVRGTQPGWFGWDLAKKVDWTVGLGLDLEGYTCRLERFRRSWDQTMQTIKLVTGRTPALVDATGVGDPIVEQLQKVPGSHYEGYVFSAQSKQRLMEGLAVAIQQGVVHFPEGPVVLELENFEFTYTRTGVKYSAPEGYDDDCVMALALAQQHKATVAPPIRVSSKALQKARQVRVPRKRPFAPIRVPKRRRMMA